MTGCNRCGHRRKWNPTAVVSLVYVLPVRGTIKLLQFAFQLSTASWAMSIHAGVFRTSAVFKSLSIRFDNFMRSNCISICNKKVTRNVCWKNPDRPLKQTKYLYLVSERTMWVKYLKRSFSIKLVQKCILNKVV